MEKNYVSYHLMSVYMRKVEMSAELKKRMTPESPERLMADAEFSLAEYIYHTGNSDGAIPHFKEAQRLAPDNWNYKRQAYLLSSNPERDYGTTFAKEVQALGDKPYYPTPSIPGMTASPTPPAKKPGG